MIKISYRLIIISNSYLKNILDIHEKVINYIHIHSLYK